MYTDKIKHIRISKGLTQKQVADATSLTTVAIQNYENHRRKPTYDVLIALADYFGVSIDYLVGRTDNPEINH